MAGGKRVKVTNWKKLQLKCFEMKQKNIMLDVEKLNQKLVKLNICAIFLYLRRNHGNLWGKLLCLNGVFCICNGIHVDVFWDRSQLL